MVNRGLGKAINSPTLLAVSLDSLMDCLTTSSVLLSAILMLTLGWNFMDGYIGILVSFLLIISGIKAVKETASPLIGEGVNKELEETIRGEVLAHKEIHGVHDFICHYYGVDKKFITLHAEIDQNTTLIEAHRIVDEIEDQLKAEYKADVTIHIDPTAIGDHEVARMELLVLHEVTMIDPRAKIHDFQMDKDNKRIDFDVLAPFDSKLTEEALKKRLLENIAAFEFSFHIDHPMGD
jgi:divalent metal cation (Fe/Co/Zn/Cd) transporter